MMALSSMFLRQHSDEILPSSDFFSSSNVISPVTSYGISDDVVVFLSSLLDNV